MRPFRRQATSPECTILAVVRFPDRIVIYCNCAKQKHVYPLKEQSASKNSEDPTE